MLSTKHNLPPLWRARVAGHRVERWIIAPCEITVPAVSEDHARRLAVAESHRRAGGLPPWRPLSRIGFEYASAEPVGELSRRRESPTPAEHEQLELAA